MEVHLLENYSVRRTSLEMVQKRCVWRSTSSKLLEFVLQLGSSGMPILSGVYTKLRPKTYKTKTYKTKTYKTKTYKTKIYITKTYKTKIYITKTYKTKTPTESYP